MAEQLKPQTTTERPKLTARDIINWLTIGSDYYPQNFAEAQSYHDMLQDIRVFMSDHFPESDDDLQERLKLAAYDEMRGEASAKGLPMPSDRG